jgi:hypothetical protein
LWWLRLLSLRPQPFAGLLFGELIVVVVRAAPS